MTLYRLEIANPSKTYFALTQLGFRPFFLSAIGFAIVGMLLWIALYSLHWQGLPHTYPAITWHAHEMLFGYILAVIAGFLLTAVRNWTSIQTLHGWTLLGLVVLWLLARLLPFTSIPLFITALVDLSFMLLLLTAVAWPIIKVKQWVQIGIVGKLALLTLANTIFYLGLLGIWQAGIQVGIYASFYLIIALILTMGRRVIPFFIEKGVGIAFKARNNIWIDRFSLALFLLFVIAELVWLSTGKSIAEGLSILLAVLQIPLHTWRLWAWYHPVIWKKPLLWVLYVAYIWLVLGFLLKVISSFLGLSPWLAIHSFAYGGMGMVTAGMMARVSLGHTGRNVFELPKLLKSSFLLLLLGCITRVIIDALMPQWHLIWILISQFLWVFAFGILLVIYFPILIKHYL